MKYPSLTEIVKYHPYHLHTFADFAHVTDVLMTAVLKEDEELTVDELIGICRYTGLKLNVIMCPKIIMLNKRNWKHRKMIADISTMMDKIFEFYYQGSSEAKIFMKYKGLNCVNLEIYFSNDRATYGHYLGVKECLEQTLSFIYHEQGKDYSKPRDIKRTV